MFKKILQSYLKFWASRYLARTKPRIVAITGSVGKTSAKEAIFAVLATKFSSDVAKSEGNLNTETGVPLAILGYTKSPTRFYQWLPIILTVPFNSFSRRAFKFLVLEMAADKPGDIRYLTSFVKPNIAVITAIGPSHLEAFGTMDKIIEEKLSILWALAGDGKVVLNIDDENLRKASYGGRWEKTTYAIDQKADLVAKDISTEIVNGQAETKFRIEGKVNLNIISKVLGQRANVLANLAGAAVGSLLDVDAQKIKTGLENVLPEKHRMQVFPGKNNTIIIDDSYNANPLSMTAALETLQSLRAKRKVAVLGDMKEIGSITSEAHKNIGLLARKIARLFVSVGVSAKKYNADKNFIDKDKAISFLLKEIRSGDTILVKASRSIGLDKVVEALKE